MVKVAQKSKKVTTIDADLYVSMYKEMLFYRRFEERVNVAYTKRKFSGFCHLHIGQEAVCVGIQKNLRPTDYMISGYRSHTQAIAKGIKSEQVFAELFGKVTGCAGGKGGSMHMFSKDKRFLGGHGIVGGQVPLAAGAGFAIKYRGEDDVVICYLGDGAVSQGQFFEALNLAAKFTLPCLFVIENNRYGMGTDYHRVTTLENLQDRALGFAMNHGQVDGMDVVAIHEQTGRIITDLRKGKGPFLLEALTYRYRGHSVSDPATYRTKEELKRYQDRDPITQHATTLIEAGLADEQTLKTWDKEIKGQVKQAEALAEQAENPSLESIWQHVYADA